MGLQKLSSLILKKKIYIYIYIFEKTKPTLSLYITTRPTDKFYYFLKSIIGLTSIFGRPTSIFLLLNI